MPEQVSELRQGENFGHAGGGGVAKVVDAKVRDFRPAACRGEGRPEGRLIEDAVLRPRDEVPVTAYHFERAAQSLGHGDEPFLVPVPLVADEPDDSLLHVDVAPLEREHFPFPASGVEETEQDRLQVFGGLGNQPDFFLAGEDAVPAFFEAGLNEGRSGLERVAVEPALALRGVQDGAEGGEFPMDVGERPGPRFGFGDDGRPEAFQFEVHQVVVPEIAQAHFPEKRLDGFQVHPEGPGVEATGDADAVVKLGVADVVFPVPLDDAADGPLEPEFGVRAGEGAVDFGEKVFQRGFCGSLCGGDPLRAVFLPESVGIFDGVRETTILKRGDRALAGSASTQHGSPRSDEI